MSTLLPIDLPPRFHRTVVIVFLVIAWMFVQASPAVGAKRLALVIGNANYKVDPLENPINDARAISRKLTRLKFDVTTLLDLKRDDIGLFTQQFLEKVSSGDTVVFFYAGHGVQLRGRNYLIASDANINTEFDIELNSIDVGRFLRRLDDTRAAVKLIFLDACRNNPFLDTMRGARNRGLARMGNAPSGTVISFATQPGGVASDGLGKNGLYTGQLLEHIGTPNIAVEQMLKRVAASTLDMSDGKQRPWIEGSLLGDFIFNPKKPDKIKIVEREKIQAEPAVSGEDLAWRFTLESNSPEGYRAFLKAFPKSKYGGAAAVKLATIGLKVAPAAQRPVAVKVIKKKPKKIVKKKPKARPKSRPKPKSTSRPKKKPPSKRKPTAVKAKRRVPKAVLSKRTIGHRFKVKSSRLDVVVMWNGTALVVERFRDIARGYDYSCTGFFSPSVITVSSNQQLSRICNYESNASIYIEHYQVTVSGKFPNVVFAPKGTSNKGDRIVDFDDSLVNTRFVSIGK